MLTENQLSDLARMLQDSSPFVRLSWMEAVTVLELMQQRGWKITAPAAEAA